MRRSDEPAKLLAVLADARNRELLVEWLRGTGWDVEVTDSVMSGEWDLCVVDDGGLSNNLDALRARKADAAPVSLPAVLVTREPTDVADLPVDDQVAIPTRKKFLHRRIETLLRTRALSVRLQSSRERYRRLVECLPEALLIVADGRIEYANAAAADLLGADAADQLADRRFSRYVEADGGSTAALLDGLVAANPTENASFEEIVIHPDGGERRLGELAAVRIVHEDQPATQVILRDLTERRERETRLRLYERALDEAIQGVTIADAQQDDMPIIYANQAFTRVTGYDVAEVIGRNCRFMQGPETEEATVDRIREAIAAEEPVAVEIRNYRPDGTMFWNALDISPIRDADGDVTHYIGLQRDVTERKERERALERYETVVKTAADGIYVLDAAHRIVELNEALTAITGHSRDALLGAQLDAFLEPEDVPACRIAPDESVTERTAEVPIRSRTGKQRHCEVTVAPLPGEEFQGTVGVVRDISDRRRREQQLSVLDRVLRHNLRNKMTVICGRAEMIEDNTSSAVVREHAGTIRSTGDDLLSLSETARSLQTMIDGGPGQTCELDLAAVVGEAVATLRDRFPGTAITTDIPDEAPVPAHESVRTALNEVIENAVVHNDSDDVRVDVSVEATADAVTVEVTDNGPGIPESELDVLSSTVETPLEHTDRLGLWLVRWALSRSNGSISFDENQPQGTVTRIQFKRP